jgi:hypothetical protein
MGLGEWLNPAIPGLKMLGSAASNIADRFWPKKLSEAEKMKYYATLFDISEKSTDSAREMFMTEMQTQSQPWLIRVLNGLVRPLGGLGALFTEFYALWGENVSRWLGIEFTPINISVEAHLVLGSVIAFYFGSRLKETLSGVVTRR